jgi:hypothetical protein
MGEGKRGSELGEVGEREREREREIRKYNK